VTCSSPNSRLPRAGADVSDGTVSAQSGALGELLRSLRGDTNAGLVTRCCGAAVFAAFQLTRTVSPELDLGGRQERADGADLQLAESVRELLTSVQATS